MWLPHLPVLVLTTCLLSATLSAPAQQQREQEAEKPLTRVKRADEVMYGNHQNSARVKKTDPDMNVLQDEEAVIDNQASQQDADALPVEPSTETDDVDTIINDIKAELPSEPATENEVEESQEIKKIGPSEEENDLAILQGKKEESALGNLKKEDDIEDEVQDEQPSETEDLTEEELAEQSQEAADQASSDEAEPVADEQLKNPYAIESWYDYFNNDAYYPNFYGSDGDRRKRSAKVDTPLTAENMMAAAPQRFKRDLTEDELKEWLEEEVGIPASEPVYYPAYEEEEPVIEEQPQGGLLERLLEAAEEEQYGYEPDVVEEEEEAYYPVSEEDTIDPDAEARAKLALLRYLYDELPEEVEDEEEEIYERSYDDEPYGEESTWENMEPAQEVEYQPIVYQGVPGIFIPVKRQYLSMMPGIKKRGADFYPYQYEPASAGRWGALLPEVNEEKRNAEAYERLYRMARALKRDDDWF